MSGAACTGHARACLPDRQVQFGSVTNLIDMDRNWGGHRFTTEFFQDLQFGGAGLKLHRTTNGKTDHVASVTFWDAEGQFFIQTVQSDVPVEIAQSLIEETMAMVKVR